MQEEPLSKDLDGKFQCTDNIIRKINYLEENPQIKEELRQNGKNYILDRFNSTTVGNMWVNFIDELL
jgi:glycosyltransferase involved in cell wall biosynthesis